MKRAIDTEYDQHVRNVRAWSQLTALVNDAQLSEVLQGAAERDLCSFADMLVAKWSKGWDADRRQVVVRIQVVPRPAQVDVGGVTAVLRSHTFELRYAGVKPPTIEYLGYEAIGGKGVGDE